MSMFKPVRRLKGDQVVTGLIMLISLFLVFSFTFFSSMWWTKLAIRQLFTAC